MKKMLSCVLAVILSALLAACNSQKGEKLCSIEVLDAAEHNSCLLYTSDAADELHIW